MDSPRSSYKTSKLTYKHIFQLICFSTKPSKIIEFGILDGFSLHCFQQFTSDSCEIMAYDIFEDFNGNHGDQQLLTNTFSKFPNIHINKGDFYNHHMNLEDNSIDIIHIDIANTGDVYDFAITHYMPKLKNTGVIILEGGSIDRDNVWWMKKYNKPLISDYLKTCPYEYTIINPYPSITIVKKETKTN
jgi:uncharacterized UPF0146 family protein